MRARSGAAATVQRVVGWGMLALGVSVFAIRLQHAGPYAPPGGGNLLAGLLALALGGGLAWGPMGTHRLVGALRWAALAASPIVLFFALYATLAELEEVVELRATHRSGEPAALRLWVVDHEGAAWVTMPRTKAEAHGLREARVELLRSGEARCVLATRFEDRETVNEIHRVRHEKYAVQRLAAALGLFGRRAGEDVVALRLEPCSESEGETGAKPATKDLGGEVGRNATIAPASAAPPEGTAKGGAPGHRKRA